MLKQLIYLFLKIKVMHQLGQNYKKKKKILRGMIMLQKEH